VDEEIARIVESEYAKSKNILEKNRAVLDTVAAELLEKETIDAKEFNAIIQMKAAEAV
jgi:cell division protease FtsH